MKKKIIPRSVGTHDGSFHADEVTACALLLLFDLIDSDHIYRTRDEALLSEYEFVCDVGGIYDPTRKRFDHHQSEYTGELSSAGMVLAYLRDQRIIEEPVYQFFNRSLILGVDAHDNGRSSQEVGVSTFSHVVSNFVPPLYNAPAELQTEAFSHALMFVRGHLKRLLERFHYIQECKQKVADVMALESEILFFEEGLPWMESFFDLGGETHPACFVIMPAGEHWKLRGIPPNTDERMKVRKPLPQEWAGLLEEDLKRVSGIPGAVFCHKGRFVSVWETKEDALKALDYVLRKGK
jgi:uncharacterized UPF0160 family protein